MSLLTRIFGAGRSDHYAQGILLFNRGEYEAAIAELEQAVSEATSESDPYRSLGRFYAAEAHMHLGMIYLRTGELERAEESFRKAVEDNPGYPDRHYYLGVLHDKRGDHAGAIHCFGEALALNPGYREARAYLAVCLAAQGDGRGAANELANAVERGYVLPVGVSVEQMANLSADGADAIRSALNTTSLCSAHVEKAAELYCRGDLLGAVEELSAAVRLQPGYADLHCRLGVLLSEVERPEEALQCFDRALAINSEYADAHMYRGMALLALGRPADAIHALATAAEAQPRSVAVLGALALAYARSGHTVRAAHTAQEALALDASTGTAREALVLVALQENRPADAHEALRGTSSLCDRGALSLAMGRPQDAVRELEQGVKLGGVTAEAEVLLGRAREALGQDDTARSHFERALLAERSYWPARLALAQNLTRHARYQDALSAIGRELEAETDDMGILLLIGECRRHLEQPAEACAAYNRALALSPSNVAALVGRGVALRMLGRDGEASADLHEAVRRDPLNMLARRLLDVTLAPAQEQTIGHRSQDSHRMKRAA
jgi:tetratricopeptide (TPR) repeat protein